MRLHVCANHPPYGAELRHEFDDSVRRLRIGDDHHGFWIIGQILFACVGKDTNDGSRLVFELWSQALADHDLLAYCILLRPVTLGHGFVDRDDRRCDRIIMCIEISSAKNRDLENAEIPRGRRDPFAVA